MYFSKNKNDESAIWLRWVDDNPIVRPPKVVKNEGKEIKIEDVCKLKECIECNIEICLNSVQEKRSK